MNPVESMVNSWKMRGVKKSDIEDAIRRIQAKRAGVEPGTEEWQKLSAALEQELKNEKLYKEAHRFGISAETVLLILAAFTITGFGLMLDLESPKALKIADLGRRFLTGFRLHA